MFSNNGLTNQPIADSILSNAADNAKSSSAIAFLKKAGNTFTCLHCNDPRKKVIRKKKTASNDSVGESQKNDSAIKIEPLADPVTGYKASKLMVRQLGHEKSNHFWLKVNNFYPHKVEIRESLELLPSGEPDFDLFVTRYKKREQTDENGWSIKDDKGNYLNIKDKDGDDIWFRCESTHHWEELIPFLSQNKENGENGIFVIPNVLGDGIKAKHWICSNTIFVETDDCSFEEQWHRINQFHKRTGMKPCLVVNSGGKSLHIYYRLDSPLTDDKKRLELQRKLVVAFRSDPKINNANREMRMAGCYRFNRDKEQVIEFYSDAKYSVEQIEEYLRRTFPNGISESHWKKYLNLKEKTSGTELKKIFYKTEEQLTPKKTTQTKRGGGDSGSYLPMQGNIWDIPFYEMLTKNQKNLINNGEGKGGRNDTCLKLSLAILGVFEGCQGRGINTVEKSSSDLLPLILEYARNCTPPMDEGEAPKVFENAQKYNPKDCLTDDCYEGKVKKYQREHYPEEYKRINRDEEILAGQPTKDYQKSKEDYFVEFEQKRREVARHHFTRTADILINEGYFPDLKLKDLPRGLIGIKGDWGTGKSYLIASLIRQYPHNRVIQIGHLNSLLFNTSQKYGLTHHHLAKDQKWGLSGCDRLAITDISVAALLKVEAYDNKSFILVLDEIEQVLNSLVNNKNLKGNLRMTYFRKLVWLIRNAEYIIFADADLSDSTLCFLESIRNAENFEHEPEIAFLIHHTKQQGLGRKIKFSKDKGATLKRLYESLDSGYKTIAAFENKSDLLAIEKSTVNDEFRKSTDIVHGDNSQDERVREFIKNIDSFYTKSNNLFYTSTLGTGIDLSRQHYDKRVAFFTGDVHAASDQCQQFSRYRLDCDSEIYCDTKKRTFKIDADQLVLDLIDKNNESNTYFCDHISKLIEAGFYPNPDGGFGEYDQAFLKLWGVINARSNASRANPYQTLVDRLAEAGYELEFLDDSEDKTDSDSTLASHKATKKQIKEQDDIAVAESRVLTDDEYLDAIRQKGNLDKEKQREVLKTRLHKVLGIPIDAGIVRLERTRKITKGIMLLHILQTDDESATAYEMRDIKNNPIITDRSHLLKKREMLKKLQIPEFLAYLNAGNSYSVSSDWVKAIAKIARANYKAMDRWLSIKIKFEKGKEGYKQSDTEIVGQILAKLGLLTTNEQSGASDNRARVYQLDTTYSNTVFRSILPHIDSKKPKQDDYHPNVNWSDVFDPAHPEWYCVPRLKNQDDEKMAESLAT